MNGQHAAHRRIPCLAALPLVVVLPLTAAAQSQEPKQQQQTQQPAQDSSQPARTVELSQLEENPRQFLNQKITVSGEVENVVGPRLFTIDEAEWVDFDGEILVAVPAPLAAMVREDTPVRVTGTMRPFVRTEIEPEWGWFEPEGVEAEFSQRAILLASSITTTDNVDVAVRLDFGTAADRPTGTSGSSTGSKAQNATNTAQTISDVGRLARTQDQSLVGSRVNLKGAKVAAVADRGGFWVSPANASEHLFVLPTEPKGGPVTQGQTVDVDGWVFQLPRGMRDRIATRQIDTKGEQVYVYATRVNKAGGQ